MAADEDTQKTPMETTETEDQAKDDIEDEIIYVRDVEQLTEKWKDLERQNNQCGQKLENLPFHQNMNVVAHNQNLRSGLCPQMRTTYQTICHQRNL